MLHDRRLDLDPGLFPPGRRWAPFPGRSLVLDPRLESFRTLLLLANDRVFAATPDTVPWLHGLPYGLTAADIRARIRQGIHPGDRPVFDVAPKGLQFYTLDPPRMGVTHLGVYRDPLPPSWEILALAISETRPTNLDFCPLTATSRQILLDWMTDLDLEQIFLAYTETLPESLWRTMRLHRPTSFLSGAQSVLLERTYVTPAVSFDETRVSPPEAFRTRVGLDTTTGEKRVHVGLFPGGTGFVGTLSLAYETMRTLGARTLQNMIGACDAVVMQKPFAGPFSRVAKAWIPEIGGFSAEAARDILALCPPTSDPSIIPLENGLEAARQVGLRKRANDLLVFDTRSGQGGLVVRGEGAKTAEKVYGRLTRGGLKVGLPTPLSQFLERLK